MDDFSHRRPVVVRRCLTAAALLLLALAGCKQLEELVGKAKEDPLVPAPPIRKAAADQASAAKPAAAPVKLDGSAQTGGTPSLPNAPTIGGGPAADDPSTQAKSPSSAGSSAAAGLAETGNAGTAAASQGAEMDGAAGRKPEMEGPAEPRKIILAGGLQTEIAAAPDAVENPGADVISPIEIEGAGARFKQGDIAAKVNGVPIFAEDVLRSMPEETQEALEQYEKAAAEGREPAEAVRKTRRQLIERFLQPHIQQELLLQALKSKHKAEQLTAFQKQLDAQFDKEVLPKLIKDKGCTSTVELERELRKHNSSIDAFRTAHRNRILAQQYLSMNAKTQDGFDAPDLREFYQKHRQDYAIVAKAKWEEIQLRFSKHGGKEKTRKKAEEILKRLEDGELFAVVAKECSDGPTKSNGGLWRWTARGNIKAKEVDEALFEQPVGQIGPPIETEDAVEIIRVTDRTPAGYQKFEDVQEDIRNQLKEAQFKRRVNELIKELTEKATIENFTDKL